MLRGWELSLNCEVVTLAVPGAFQAVDEDLGVTVAAIIAIKLSVRSVHLHCSSEICGCLLEFNLNHTLFNPRALAKHKCKLFELATGCMDAC